MGVPCKSMRGALVCKSGLQEWSKRFTVDSKKLEHGSMEVYGPHMSYCTVCNSRFAGFGILS